MVRLALVGYKIIYTADSRVQRVVRIAIPSPEDGIGNGVSSHKYRRDKYRPGRSGRWVVDAKFGRAVLGTTGSGKARRRRRRQLLCLPSATRAASLPQDLAPPGPPPPTTRPCTQNGRQLYHLVFALRFTPCWLMIKQFNTLFWFFPSMVKCYQVHSFIRFWI